ncbi:MAG: laccase domain protein [Pseudohongiella sp.]|nr:MAG: laccase domain protein [Pseudohongiella sp.]
MTAEQTIFADWDVSPNIVAFSTTRLGGVSKPPYDSFNVATHVQDDPGSVDSNRKLLRGRFPKRLVWQWLEQVHGTDVAIVDEAGPDLTADALSTAQPNLVCCIQTADCLPLLVSAIDGSEVAAVHAGWKGLASGVIENTIAHMSTPAVELAVWLGPAIGPCHYEVGEEVREAFLRNAGSPLQAAALEDCFTASPNRGKYMADLYGVSRQKLADLGVGELSGGEHCSHCDAERFYSYRREGVTGRMLSAIYIDA